MKTTHILIGLMAAGSTMMAGDPVIPHTFTAGNTAKAAEVNENFDALKSAVHGNYNDIATNKNNITDNANDIATNENDIQTNKTTIDQKVTTIAVTGGLDVNRTPDGDVTLTLRKGYISVPSVAYQASETERCDVKRTGFYFSFKDSSSYSNCEAFVPLSLPDGATITSLKCMLYKNDGQINTALNIGFNRKSSTALYQQIAGVKLEADHNEATWSDVNTSSFSHRIVDNKKYVYFLKFDPPNNTNTINGEKNKVSMCYIGYEFQ